MDENFNLEIHFFLNDIEKVRQNIFDDDEDDSLAGSPLGVLLKEEFFRSSIVISGRAPFWWAVPADSDDRMYSQWLSVAVGKGLMDSFVDLGNLYPVANGRNSWEEPSFRF